jgi:hypothetical protein
MRGNVFRRRCRRARLAALVVLGPSRAAFALDGLGDVRALPCRPTIACTADFVPPGSFEVEMGALFRRVGAEGRQWTLPLLAKLTLAEWLQAQVGSNGYTVTRGDMPAQYFDDVTAGLKVHLVDQRAIVPSVSVSATASLPTFPATGYLRTVDALLIAYVTKDLGPIHADWNLGWNAWRIDGDPRAQAWTALALSANLSPIFGVMAETYYFSDAAPIAPRDGGLLFAISHTPRRWLVFDFGGDVGFFPSSRAYSLFLGLTVVPFLLGPAAP